MAEGNSVKQEVPCAEGLVLILTEPQVKLPK